MHSESILRSVPPISPRTPSYFLPAYRSLPSSPKRTTARYSPCSPHGGYSHIIDEERQVERLEDWGKEEIVSDTVRRVRFAEFALSVHTEKSQVDKAILERRSKKMAQREGTTSDSSLKHVQEVTLKRLMKKETTSLNRERSLYARRHEDELEKIVLELTTKLHTLTMEADQSRVEASHYRERLNAAREDLKASKRILPVLGSADRSKTHILPHADEFAKIQFARSQRASFLFTKELESQKTQLSSSDQIRALRTTAGFLDSETSHVRKELEEVRSVQTKHYVRLMAEGVDSRGEGLSWVVRKLWQAGSLVTADMFPTFMDQEAVQTVLFLAQKNNEIEELNDYLRTARPDSVCSPLAMLRWNHISDRLKAISGRLHLGVTGKSPDDGKAASTPRSGGIDRSTSQFEAQLIDVTTIEQRITELNLLVSQTKEAEIRRLTTECFLNNYEKRYKTSLRTLVAALVGVDVMDRYLTTINKEQKNLTEQLKKTKTFAFVSKAN